MHGLRGQGQSVCECMQVLRIALDIADALQYLHHQSNPQILHRRLGLPEMRNWPYLAP